MSPRIVAATLGVLLAWTAPVHAQEQPISPETTPAPAPDPTPGAAWTEPTRAQDDNWDSLIHHGQRASGEESLEQLEARTLAREQVYERRRGISFGLGAELAGLAGQRIESSHDYGHLTSDFGAAGAAVLRYGLGLIALEGTARLGAGVYATDLDDGGGLGPMLGGRLGGRVYFGTLPAYVALHASADVHLLSESGAQAALGLDAALGLVLGPEERWDVTARLAISDFSHSWQGEGFECSLAVIYWLPRS